MKKTLITWTGIALVGLLGVIGCESTTPAPVASIAEMGRDSTNADILRITADNLSGIPEGSTLVVRTTQSDEIVIFDHSRGEIDFSRLEIVCPNGQQMHMDTWLADVAASRGLSLDVFKTGEFSIALTRETAEVLFEESNEDPTSLKPMLEEGCSNQSYCCGAQNCSRLP